MSDDIKNDPLLDEAKLIATKNDLYNLLNSGLKICCPKCHSTDYDLWPTGISGASPEHMFPEEDIHYICKECLWIWNSGFMGDKYGHRKSMIEGYKK